MGLTLRNSILITPSQRCKEPQEWSSKQGSIPLPSKTASPVSSLPFLFLKVDETTQTRAPCQGIKEEKGQKADDEPVLSLLFSFLSNPPTQQSP